MMKNRFSPLVKLKKSQLQEAETMVQKAIMRLENAKKALSESQAELQSIGGAHSGEMQEFLAQRVLVEAQLRLIEKNKVWVDFEERQLQSLQEELKKALLEYEKFVYLEAEEFKAYQKKLSIQEAKRLDEIAVMRFARKEVS